jgi:hypothetical protein
MDLKEGDCIVHDARKAICLITNRVFAGRVLIGYIYVPWRGDHWAPQTNPPRFIKLHNEYAGERINLASIKRCANPFRKIVAV